MLHIFYTIIDETRVPTSACERGGTAEISWATVSAARAGNKVGLPANQRLDQVNSAGRPDAAPDVRLQG
jgi:hypothetical protein